MQRLPFPPEKPPLMIGAAPLAPETLPPLARLTGRVIALDGGIKAAQSAGLTVDVHLGDMDSSDPKSAALKRVVLRDQNQTDFAKALAWAGAPLVLAAGVLGGRLDHQLATFSSLITAPSFIIAVDTTTCVFCAPAGVQMQLDVPRGSDVAFYPLRPVKVDIKGTKWPLKGAQMAPEDLISTSNKMQTDHLSLMADQRALLCILPRAVLPALTKWALGFLGGGSKKGEARQDGD